jgi:HD-like signal output (HDOD) protein
MNVVSLPSILTRVEALVRSDDYTPEQLSTLISQDPVLAADVIKLVNSAYYQRGQQEITNLATAVVRLGGYKINELVLTVVMHNITDIKPIYFKLFGKYLWDHSFATAIWAQKLAKDRGADADLAYFLGLIHDVGKIALFKLIVEEMHLSDPELGTNSKLFRQMMTKHSLRLSALIAQAWLLPGSVVKALQEQGVATVQRDRTLAGQILHEANLYSEIYLLLQQGLLTPIQAREFCQQNGLDTDTCIQGISALR